MSDNIVLTDEQNRAVKAIKEWYRGGKSTKQVFKLIGYAGTGKTSCVNTVVKELNVTAITAAFTGKAVNVLRQKGNHNAITMHRGMYMPMEDDDGNISFELGGITAPFRTAHLIIIDEGSMINEALAKDAESFGHKILVMGDPGQLPPVEGVGYWLQGEPDFILTKIHRQALDSPILRIATMLRRGLDVPIGEWEDSEGNITRVLPYNNDNLQHVFREDTQPLVGTNRSRHAITQYIRGDRGFEGVHPLPNEPIINCRNNIKLGIFNGSQGTLLANKHLSGGDYMFKIEFEDIPKPLAFLRTNPYMFQQHFDDNIRRPRLAKTVYEMDWGYVLTCHKAQGSEWRDVTVIDDSGVFREDKHKWAYTATTRASKSLTFLKRG